MYVTNALSATIAVIDKKNVGIDTFEAGSAPAGMTVYAGSGNMNVSNSPSYTVRVTGIISPIPILEDIPQGITYVDSQVMEIGIPNLQFIKVNQQKRIVA